MKHNKIGISDVPCYDRNQDSLDVGNYVRALEKFVLNCTTPMSIALQGDWGTGKTSFLQAMRNDFKQENPEIKTIYFNTWQYSQFNMSENLYASFITNIVNELSVYKSELKDKAKEIGTQVLSFSSSVVKSVIKEKTSIDIDSITSKEIEKAAVIKDLKNKFAQIINEVKGDGRVVIFVDDLDRLNPEVAVELLEVMKLFMDVEDCVFVLAIDYEVVVNGIRKKFGNHMSEEKCRSFFDKIIQLPFRMPVDAYNIEKLMEQIIGDKIKKYINPISMLVKQTLGANPRTLKRLANSFFLLGMVENEVSNERSADDSEKQSALLFVSLVSQMYCYDAYREMINCEDAESLSQLFVDREDESTEEDAVDEKAVREYKQKMNDTLKLVNLTIKKIDEMANDKDDIYDNFRQALNLSSITSVASIGADGNSERKKALKVNEIGIFGKRIQVKNPTEAQILTYRMLLERDMDKISGFMAAYPRILTTDATLKNSFFRASKKLGLELEGKVLYIGTSSSSADKILFTQHLCDYLKLEPRSVLWYDEGQEIFVN